MHDDYDQTLERALLAHLLKQPDLIDNLGAFTPKDLADPQCRQMLAEIIKLADEGALPNTVRLRQRLGLSGETADCDFVGAIQAYAVGYSLPPASDVLKALREASDRRRLRVLIEHVRAAAADPSQGPAQVISTFMVEADEILAASTPQGQTLLTLSEAAEHFVRGLNEDPSQVYIATGFPSIDKLLDGGLPRGEMSVIAARPSMGKTAMALSISLSVASRKHGVLYLSQEMPVNPFMARVASIAYMDRTKNAVPYSTMRPGIIDSRHRAGIERAVQEASDGVPMIVEVRRNTPITQVRSIIRKARRALCDNYGVTLDMVVVDHMGLIDAPKILHGNRVQAVSFISNSLAQIAKEENVAMVALSQLNRDSEKGDDTRPQLHHLRDSGSIEQDATTVLFPFRPAYKYERQIKSMSPPSLIGSMSCAVDKDADRRQVEITIENLKNVLEIGVAKNRNGSSGSVSLDVDMATNTMTDPLLSLIHI